MFASSWCRERGLNTRGALAEIENGEKSLLSVVCLRETVRLLMAPSRPGRVASGTRRAGTRSNTVATVQRTDGRRSLVLGCRALEPRS